MTDQLIPLQQYIERLLSEQEKRQADVTNARNLFVDSRIRANEEAFRAALASLRDSTSASFAHSESSATKAAEAQSVYNVVHNDLAHKLEVQSKELVSRADVIIWVKSYEDKLNALAATFNAELKAIDRRVTTNENGVAKLEGRLLAIGVGNTILTVVAAFASVILILINH